MRVVPTFAVSPGIVITKMEQSRNLHVFVVAKGTAEVFTPPEAVDDYPDSEAYAGHGTIFGLFPPGGCQACKFRPPFDGECRDLFSAFLAESPVHVCAVSIDITDALRSNNLRKAEAELVVMVENADGTVQPLAETPVPPLKIRGPKFETLQVPDVSDEGENHAADVEAMQRFLIANGYGGLTDEVFGTVGAQTVAAIRAFQQATGLVVDGIAGQKTKAKVVAPQFDTDAHITRQSDRVGLAAKDADKPTFKRGDTVTWSLDLPVPGYLDQAKLIEELHGAFRSWTPACGVIFEHVEGGTVTVGFDSTGDGDYIFDGPGGALAKTILGKELQILFDWEEKWLLQTDPEPARHGAFRVLPVAVHEVGHLLGLGHSARPEDTMAPYYRAALTAPGKNDLVRCEGLYK